MNPIVLVALGIVVAYIYGTDISLWILGPSLYVVVLFGE